MEFIGRLSGMALLLKRNSQPDYMAEQKTQNGLQSFCLTTFILGYIIEIMFKNNSKILGEFNAKNNVMVHKKI